MRSIFDETEDLTWQEYANCLGVDPDLFFPERGASTREAKEVCRGCVVRDDCLEYALTNGEKFGIWGGMSERERRRIRRQRAIAREAAAVAGHRPHRLIPVGAQRPRRASTVRSSARSRVGPPLGCHRLQHPTGQQAHQLGAGQLDPGGDAVVGVGRAYPERFHEVHRHLHPVPDGEAEGPDAVSPHRGGDRPGPVQVRLGQPEVVGDQRRPTAHGHRPGRRDGAGQVLCPGPGPRTPDGAPRAGSDGHPPPRR